MITKLKNNKFALVLCSGGARGFSHIGILEELEKHNLKPSFISGTSMGAIIGALYCSGIDIKIIKKIVINCEWKDNLKFTIPKKGIINGIKIKNYLNKLLKNANFSDLKIPLEITAVDIKSGKKVIINKGNVAKAVYASMAIPGLFTPEKYNDMLLVDGGLIDPLPIDTKNVLKYNNIIAIDLSFDEKEFKKNKDKIYGIDTNSEFYHYMKKKMIQSQNEFIKEYLTEHKNKKMPKFAKNSIEKMVDKFFNPDKLMKKNYIKYVPEIANILSRSIYIMMNQLIIEKIKNSKNLIIIKPKLSGITIIDLDKAEFVIKAGINATKKILK
jgi:NTE family protein